MDFLLCLIELTPKFANNNVRVSESATLCLCSGIANVDNPLPRTELPPRSAANFCSLTYAPLRFLWPPRVAYSRKSWKCLLVCLCACVNDLVTVSATTMYPACFQFKRMLGHSLIIECGKLRERFSVCHSAWKHVRSHAQLRRTLCPYLLWTSPRVTFAQSYPMIETLSGFHILSLRHSCESLTWSISDYH